MKFNMEAELAGLAIRDPRTVLGGIYLLGSTAGRGQTRADMARHDQTRPDNAAAMQIGRNTSGRQRRCSRQQRARCCRGELTRSPRKVRSTKSWKPSTGGRGGRQTHLGLGMAPALSPMRAPPCFASKRLGSLQRAGCGDCEGGL